MSKLTAKDLERFWAKVDRSGGAEACWLWTGAADSKGYGRFHVGPKRNTSRLAHRIAYAISTGGYPIAVCHRCDTPDCCNPRHLFGGTRADNNRDMMQKGRHWSQTAPGESVKGESHGSARLNNDAVSVIRWLYDGGDISQRALAAFFGVSQRTITKIVLRTGWGHV